MNPKQISQDDLVMFALQELTPAEAAEVMVHLEHSEAARNELAKIQGDLAMYALTSEMHSPPAQARERLLRLVSKENISNQNVSKQTLFRESVSRESISRERKAASLLPEVPVERAEEPVLLPRTARVFRKEDEFAPRRSGMGFFGWAGWAVAACCVATAGYEYQQHLSLQQAFDAQKLRLTEVNERVAEATKAQAVMKMLTGGGAMQVTLHPANNPQPAKPEGHAAYIADTGSLVFVGLHLAPLQPYKTYQLWVIPADGHDPIPAGIFKPDLRGFASVVLPELPKGVIAKTFGVTIEDDGGATSPTPPIILAGM